MIEFAEGAANRLPGAAAMIPRRNPRPIKNNGVIVGYHPSGTHRDRLIAIVRDYCRWPQDKARRFVARAIREAHLMNAGWRPVWLHVTIATPPSDAPRRRLVGRRRPNPMGRHVFSRGGWICATCVPRFAPRWVRPRERKLVLVPDVHQEGRTR